MTGCEWQRRQPRQGALLQKRQRSLPLALWRCSLCAVAATAAALPRLLRLGPLAVVSPIPVNPNIRPLRRTSGPQYYDLGPAVPQEQLEKLPPKDPDPFEMDRLSYEQALKEYAENANWGKAMETIEEMGARGFRRSRQCWNWAFEACSKTGRYEEAKKLLKDMKSVGMTPGSEAYNMAIAACEGQGVPLEVGAFLMDMRLSGFLPNWLTFLKAMDMMIADNHYEDAKTLYSNARELGVIHPWTERYYLDLRDYSDEVSVLILRHELELRATDLATVRLCGKKGWSVLTGMATKAGNVKQRAIINVLQREYRLHIYVENAKFGKLAISGESLMKLGEDLAGINPDDDEVNRPWLWSPSPDKRKYDMFAHPTQRRKSISQRDEKRKEQIPWFQQTPKGTVVEDEGPGQQMDNGKGKRGPLWQWQTAGKKQKR